MYTFIYIYTHIHKYMIDKEGGGVRLTTCPFWPAARPKKEIIPFLESELEGSVSGLNSGLSKCA